MGIEISPELEALLANLKPEERAQFMKVASLPAEDIDKIVESKFRTECEEIFAKGDNNSLRTFLEVVGFVPNGPDFVALSPEEQNTVKHRIGLFITGVDVLKGHIAKTLSSEKRHNTRASEKNRDWKGDEKFIKSFLDVVNEKDTKGGLKHHTLGEIGEACANAEVGRLSSAQVSAAFKQLKEGTYAHFGLPAKEYDPNPGRQPGRQKS